MCVHLEYWWASIKYVVKMQFEIEARKVTFPQCPNGSMCKKIARESVRIQIKVLKVWSSLRHCLDWKACSYERKKFIRAQSLSKSHAKLFALYWCSFRSLVVNIVTAVWLRLESTVYENLISKWLWQLGFDDFFGSHFFFKFPKYLFSG